MTDQDDRLSAALADRYVVEGKLGHGGMADVYLAKDLKHERRVALKVLRPELSAVLGADRFLHEIKVTANLQHPHILQLYDSGHAAEFVYYVMPYFEGDSLRDRLNQQRQLSVDEAVEIARTLAMALDYAHRHNVVHRDIKPDNILLQDGQPVLSDFGIALAVQAAAGPRLTSTGLSLGTPHYMSPEQATGGDVDGRADQYSLACLMYEMLAGEPPFHGTTAQALIARHINDPVPPLKTVRAGISSSINQAITKAMSKSPADRYDTVGAFVDDLTRVRAVGAVVSRGTGRRRWLMATATIVGIIAIGLAALQFGRDTVTLDRHRVMVFPLVVAASGGLDPTVGEDLSTMIGHALDGAGSLRWIDAWPLMDTDQRDDIRRLTMVGARRLGESKECGFIVTGRVVSRGDSVDVLLDLTDVAGDSIMSRASASGISGEAWRVGLQAVNGLLPALIERSVRSDRLFERNPAAVAHFLTGERHFRRAQSDLALAAYAEALAADSTFVQAAMRGAQAATWEHQYDLARTMAQVALELPLTTRDRRFAQGFVARLRGDADEALSEFEAALAEDAEFIEAWMLIGETFRHLAPRRPGMDAEITAAMRRALAIDSTAVDPLFHLLEVELRNEQLDAAAPLMARFRAANPDPRLVANLALAEECVRGGPQSPGIVTVGRDNPNVASVVAPWLANGGNQIDCAIAMWQSILRGDSGTSLSTAGVIDAALTGLHNGLIAKGQIADALMLLDSGRVSTDAMRRAGGGEPRWNGRSPVEWDRETRLRARNLLMLNEIIGVDVGDRSLSVAEEDFAEWGVNYARAFSDGLWRRAVWEAWRGELGKAEALRDTLVLRTDSASERIRSLVNVLPAHFALARGDTVEALRRFATARPMAPQANLNFHFAYAMGLERLLESRLLLAAGRYHEAITIASLMDMNPLSYLQYLASSLEVRLAASEALGEAAMAEVYRSRLTRLRAF